MKNTRKNLLKVCIACLLSASSLGLMSCEDTSVTYTFQTNGGAVIESVTLEEGSEYALPTPEAREGYEFLGWYATEDFSGEAITSVVAAEDQTYYAKWEQLCAVTLDANGGTLSTSKLYLKEGESVYNAVAELVPEKGAGYEFGAWYNGETKLSQSLTATVDGVTLTAKYKVQYTVEVWTQTATLDGYELTQNKIVGYEYAGKEYRSLQTVEGFKEIDHENSCTTLTISETPSENVIKHYFDREIYTVIFNANYPDGSKGESKSERVVCGQSVEIPSDYTFEGYCFVGWATSENGKVEYKGNYIDSVLYNKSEGDVESVTFQPVRNMALYAVWEAGYVDMFGGNDYIYHFDNEETIYLSRGNVFFEGEYDSRNGEFFFYDEKENIILEGKLNADKTFSYKDEIRADYVASLYKYPDGLYDSTKILFDSYNGITYVDKGKSSKGTYTIDESGYYTATFTEGEKAGEQMVFLTGTVTVENVETTAFQVRNEEEFAMGQLLRFGVNGHNIGSYSAYDIILSGFGVAYFNNGSSYANYYYTQKDNGDYELLNSSGASQGVIRLMEVEGKKGYMFYNEAMDNVFKASNGASLTLDGVYQATYTDGDTTISGYYTYTSSVFGGVIVTMADANGAEYTYLLSTTTSEVTKETTDENGETVETTETITNYLFENKNNGYAEYYYQDAEGTYYAPLFVITDAANKKASVYGYTESRTYEVVSDGTYTYDEATKLYTYTASKYYEAAVLTSPVDLATVKTFVFALDNTTTRYQINYWYSYTTQEEVKTSFGEVYESAAGGSLTLIAGLAIYEENGYLLTGTYQKQGNLLQISTASGSVYVELDADNGAFLTLDHAPYSASILLENGQVSKTEYVSFDGKGGIIYSVIEENEEGEEVVRNYSGSYTDTEEATEWGFRIYAFKSEDEKVAFKFIQLATSSAMYIARYNETYNGKYDAENGARLTLDGYGYMASYLFDGEKVEGMYYVSAQDLIVLITNNGYMHFKTNADKTMVVLGEEYGTYLLMDNQGFKNVYLTFDGLGKVRVFTFEEEEVVIDEAGTYVSENDTYVVTYKENGTPVTLVGKFGTYEYSGSAFNTFVVSHNEVKKLYVNDKDWSILILDESGNAIKYNEKGILEHGTYMIIAPKTDNSSAILYYVNQAGTDACIYEFDVEKGTATKMQFRSRGYYTKNLEGLQFSQYGFAIFNGDERNYYNVVDGNVIVYHQDPTNSEANEYGFVARNLGEFGDTLEYENKLYYSADGYALMFARKAATKDDYKVLVDSEKGTKCALENLTFTPAGSTEFTVRGSVVLNGETYSCYVTRELNEENVMETYVTIGYYRFDISISYTGALENEYEVIGMRYEYSLPSYAYMSNLYMYYIYDMFLGTNFAAGYTNDIGTIAFITVFDKAGEEVEKYFTATFGTASGMYDLNGNIISIEKADYEYKDGIYTVKYLGADGYNYNLYIASQYQSGFQSYGYVMYAFTREENVPKTTEGYSVFVERVIASDYGLAPGSVFSITLKQNGEEVKADNIIIKDEAYYYIVRDKDENGVITATRYYKLTFKEAHSGELEEEESVIIPLYETAEVVSLSVQTLYTEDGESYVDICEDTDIMVFSVKDSLYVVAEQTYDEATKTYTVKTGSEEEYKITINGDKVVIEKVAEEKTEETAA